MVETASEEHGWHRIGAAALPGNGGSHRELIQAGFKRLAGLLAACKSPDHDKTPNLGWDYQGCHVVSPRLKLASNRWELFVHNDAETSVLIRSAANGVYNPGGQPLGMVTLKVRNLPVLREARNGRGPRPRISPTGTWQRGLGGLADSCL